MVSVAGLTRSRLTRAAALLALLIFGWQGATQGVTPLVLHLAASAAAPTTVAPAELVPTHTILPLAPVEVAKPAPPAGRASAASLLLAVSVVAFAEPSRPWRDTDCTEARPPAALLCPPYAARAPPLFS